LDYYGYVGKVLCVDLTSGKIETQQLDENVIKDFLGGWGINYRLEYDLLKPGTDPLSPDNPIIIGAGPLCGTLALGSGKVAATMKLPIRASKHEEKYIVATAVGGSNQFGIMMKNAGYDHIVITGRAKKPSYLKIVDDDIEICDAGDLWGKRDIYETSDELADRHRGKTGKAGTWVIGKAGENLLMASLGFVDGLHTMGRWGGAAVLGSKNLKAVVTLGTKGVKVADPKRFMALVDRKRKQIMSHPEFGLPPSESFFETFNLCGIPLGKSPYPGDLFGKTMYASWGCPSCLGPCKTALKIKEGRFAGTTLKTIPVVIYEAEKVGKLRLPHYGEAVKLVDLMHRYGMCMFTGVRMLHFVTRLFERGVISAQDTGGLELRTGDIDSYIRLLEKWVDREGIGDYMAQGWFAISERVGVDAATDFEDGVPEDIQQSLSEVRRDLVEKTGLPEEETDRMFTANEFNYGMVLKHSEDAEAVFTSLGTCAGGGPDDPGRDMPGLSEIYSAVTGFSATPKELRSKGERIRNMEALLNVREGIMGEDYEPPALWLEHTEKPIRVATGDLYATDWFGRRITKDEIYKWMRDYYTERGWDINNRIPTREKLRELGLEEFVCIVEPYLA